MRVAALPALLLVAACGGGAARPPLAASDVVEYAALPPGYELGERLSERCAGKRGLRSIRNESLLSVDCGVERLSNVLRARAAERGAAVLVGKRCRVSGREAIKAQCSASLALPTKQAPRTALLASASAPSPAQVYELDEPRPQDGARIQVSFEPLEEARRWPARTYDRVAETSIASVGRRGLGQVSARCDDCDDMALRHALRVTAGRVGAGEVAAVRCFQDDDRRCVATALEPWSY